MDISDWEKLKHYTLGMGDFRIKPFPLVHDVPCSGFHITHPDMGTLIYATDTEYIKYRFKNLNHILVEANYGDELIEQNAVNREHVLRGHMSLQTALNFISTNDNPMLENIVLIHLSQTNGDPVEFLQKTKETIKYGAECYIAEPELEISLDLIPFM
jgi:phosphoribosyl 1,2-cyclic phosphodiesterase